MIDQFEELFALVDDEQRDRFLDSLITLATDPRGRTRVLVTLRADFYDRPLMHPAFGRMMTGNVFNVTPLAADELEAAALGPAQRVGVTFEQGLLTELITEVSGQPNALPLFQYTLTELFDRRDDSTLTRGAYQVLGGIRGAVASRAEEIYQHLQLEQQDAARQLFLRLVTVGRDSETRRVVTASELVTLDVDIVTMHAALEAFVASRLLVRDRDAVSGALTVEVAHEALLGEWSRLRGWIDDGRDDLRQHGAYSLVVDEWLTAGRDPDYLLAGGRLDLFEQWRATTTMRLTTLEREFLDEALRQRELVEAAESARGAQQARLRRRGRRRAFALGAVAAGIMTAAIVAVVAAVPSGPAPRIALVASTDPADSQPGELFEQGLVRAERDFDLEVDRRDSARTGDARNRTVRCRLRRRDPRPGRFGRDETGDVRPGQVVRVDRPHRVPFRRRPQRHDVLVGGRTGRVPRRCRRGDDDRDRHRRLHRGRTVRCTKRSSEPASKPAQSRSTPTSRSSPPISGSPDSAAVHRSTHQTVPDKSPVCSTTAAPM